MRRIIFLKVGGKQLHLPKLIGALIIFGALFEIMYAAAALFEATDSISSVNACLSSATNISEVSVCQMQAKNALNIFPRFNQTALNSRQIFMPLAKPMVGILFWLAVFVFGILLYKTGKVYLPLEEQVEEESEVPKGRATKRKAKKKE